MLRNLASASLVLLSAVAAATSIMLLLVPVGAGAGTTVSVRFVSPDPAGLADGSNWENAASLERMAQLVADLSSGGEIRLRADAGPYSIEDPIILGERNADAEVTIRGVDPGPGDARAVLLGGRTSPYSPETANTGRAIFALDTGADGLTFERLSFKNVGNGCFLLRGAVHALTIADVRATNVRRFIENEDNDSANVEGLVIRQTRVLGFSKDAVRLQNNTHGVLIEDVLVDSRGQDGDHFAMGFHLTETVHDVVFRRVVAMNARDSLSDYRNGDGFVAERNTYNLLFEDTAAIDNMDAGYDIKASKVTLVDAMASGNKRNYRFWGSDVRMSGCRGMTPIRRGGIGTEAQVWGGTAAQFMIEDSRFIGGDADTIVFDLEASAVGSADRTTVRQPEGGDLVSLSDGAEMTLNGIRLRD